MAKPNITTRATKGSALTWTEGDANLENLRDATISIKADTAGASVVSDLNGEITLVAGTNVTLTGDNTAKTITIDAAGGGISNIVEDTTPQLGGTLDANGNEIDMGTNTITDTKVGNWDTAYSWGNHASAGYQSALGFTPENSANKGTANGYASLDANGLVPSTQLPSYVDDVLEYASLATFPTTGETGKIYVAADTSRSYRWTGSVYSEIISSPGTTDNVTEGATNLYFTTARARSSVSAGTGISYDNSTGVIASTVTSGISSVSADTAPALGGDLDVNTKAIVSTSNGNIRIKPNGSGNIMLTPSTGQIILGSTNYPTSTPSSGQVLTAGSGGQLTWSTPSGGSGTVTSVSGTGTVNGLSLTGTVTDSGSLTLGGTLDLSSPPAIGGTTANSGTFSAVNVKSQGNLNLYDFSNSFTTSLRSGNTSQNLAFTLPSTYGYNTQILSTNGAGALTWTNGGISVTTTTTNTNYNIMTTSIMGNTSGVTTSYIDSTSGKFAYNPSSGVLTVPALNFKYVTEPAYALTYAATITPNVANGTVQTITLTGNVTFSAFTSPVAGQSLTLIVKQDATGSRTLTSTMKFAGGTKTLSTAANSVDIISVFYDGTTYWASLSTDFK